MNGQRPRRYDEIFGIAAKINQIVLIQPAATWITLALFCTTGAFLLSSTLYMSDTDLWYHLAGGRHFFATWQTSNPFDRSYLTGVNEFHNYFWGFQAFLYSMWLIAGYIGILVFKAILVLTSGYFVMKLICRDQPVSAASFTQLLVLALILYLLSMRGISVRPHYFSYLFIPLFSYILIYKRQWFPVLPVLTLVWVNTHGVEWVIGALICGSFTLQQVLVYGRTRDVGELRPCIWIVLCLPVVLMNPSGPYLLETPFISPPEIYQFIAELGPFDFQAALDLGSGLNSSTAGLALAVILLFGCFRLRDANLSDHIFPLLLAIGGAILITRGSRFLWEATLLATPLLAIVMQPDTARIDLKRFIALLLLLLVIGRAFFLANSPLVHTYPLAEDTLPRGTTDFIEELGIEGKYLVPAGYAGYVEWRLPSIKVHMDLQMPPFSSFDYFESFTAQHSKAGLTHLINKYHPDIIGIPRSNTNFPDFASGTEYVPVVFDQLLVLYVNRISHSDIADQYQLHQLNPFNPDSTSPATLDQAIAELETMLSVTPNLPDARLALTGYLIAQRRYEDALTHLHVLAAWQPDNQSVLFYQADIAHQQGNYQTAILHYSKLLKLTDEPHKIGSLLGECYFRSEDYLNAYKSFSASINPYRDVENNLVHYYFFAFSSYMTGDPDQARKLIRMIEALYQGNNEPLIQEVKVLKQLVDV